MLPPAPIIHDSWRLRLGGVSAVLIVDMVGLVSGRGTVLLPLV